MIDLYVLLWLSFSIVTMVFYVFPFFSENSAIVERIANSALVRWQRRFTPISVVVLVVLTGWHVLRTHFMTDAGDICGALRAQSRYITSALLVLAILFMRRFYGLLRRNAEGYLAFQRSARERDESELIEGFRVPPLALISPYLDLYSWLIRPKFYNVEHVPCGPSLLAANHSLGGLEIPLIVHHVYKTRNVFLRGMADRVHDRIPLWGGLLHTLGVMGGSRERCRRCLRSNQPVLTFPGGAREMLKRKGDPKYSLHWGDHAGFARMAIEAQVPIVPVCTVGIEDMLEIIADIPVHALLGRELTAPLVTIPGVARLQRVYIAFMPPIETAHYAGATTEANIKEVRDATELAIRHGIVFLQKEQQNDPERFLFTQNDAQIAKEVMKNFKLEDLHSS